MICKMICKIWLKITTNSVVLWTSESILFFANMVLRCILSWLWFETRHGDVMDVVRHHIVRTISYMRYVRYSGNRPTTSQWKDVGSMQTDEGRSYGASMSLTVPSQKRQTNPKQCDEVDDHRQSNRKRWNSVIENRVFYQLDLAPRR